MRAILRESKRRNAPGNKQAIEKGVSEPESSRKAYVEMGNNFSGSVHMSAINISPIMHHVKISPRTDGTTQLGVRQNWVTWTVGSSVMQGTNCVLKQRRKFWNASWDARSLRYSRRCTIPHHSHSLPSKINIWIPPRRMEHLPFELF